MKEFLEYKIFEIGTYTLRVSNIVSFLLFATIITIILMVMKRLIYRSHRIDSAKKFSINRLSQYVIVIFAILISLHILGFNITVFMAGSAALLVGIGFGLQNLFSDFISGIILLLDGTLKVGDIIEVNGMIYKVLKIDFRTTTVLGRDENNVILPNSQLTGNSVINWTHDKISSRFKITLGVGYETDIAVLMPLLKEVALRHEKVLKKPLPFVRFEDYGDSALIFSVYFYTNEVFRVENIKSEIRVEIFNELKKNSINIPFPQRVVHITKTEL